MAGKKVNIDINYSVQTKQLEKATKLLEQFQKSLTELKKNGINLTVHVNRKSNGKERRQAKKV